MLNCYDFALCNIKLSRIISVLCILITPFLIVNLIYSIKNYEHIENINNKVDKQFKKEFGKYGQLFYPSQCNLGMYKEIRCKIWTADKLNRYIIYSRIYILPNDKLIFSSLRVVQRRIKEEDIK